MSPQKSNFPHIDKMEKSLLSLIAVNYNPETDKKRKKNMPGDFFFFLCTRHSKRSPQALRHLLVVELFQIHPPQSHYLTDQINLLSAQVLVS